MYHLIFNNEILFLYFVFFFYLNSYDFKRIFSRRTKCSVSIFLSRLGLENSPTVSLQRVKTPPHTHNECHRYGIKQSDGKALVRLELWGIWSTPSLPMLPGPLWPGVVASDRVLSVGQIELFDI